MGQSLLFLRAHERTGETGGVRRALHAIPWPRARSLACMFLCQLAGRLQGSRTAVLVRETPKASARRGAPTSAPDDAQTISLHLLVAGTGGEAAGRALPLGAVVGRVDSAVRGSVFLVDMWASDHCSLGSMAMTPALHASWSQASKSMEALACCPAGSGTPVLQRQVVQTSTRSCEPLTAHSGHTCLLPLGTWKTGTSGCHPEVCRLAVCTTGSHPVYRRSAE